MVNTAAKGAGIEAQAKAELERLGYEVHRTVRNPIFSPQKGYVGSHNNDVFGVFDLVATHPDLDQRYVQVTVGTEVQRRMDKVQPIALKFPTRAMELGLLTAEVWGWVGGAKRLDGRFKSERRFIRRQFWHRFVWRVCLEDTFEPGWQNVTDPNAGWADHGGKAPA